MIKFSFGGSRIFQRMVALMDHWVIQKPGKVEKADHLEMRYTVIAFVLFIFMIIYEESDRKDRR